MKTFLFKIRKRAKIRNRYNQSPHLTQDTNGKVTNSQLDITNESQEVSSSPNLFYTKNWLLEVKTLILLVFGTVSLVYHLLHLTICMQVIVHTVLSSADIIFQN